MLFIILLYVKIIKQLFALFCFAFCCSCRLAFVIGGMVIITFVFTVAAVAEKKS